MTEVSLEAGDTVNSGNTLFILNDYDEVTVTVSVEESDLANIREGDSVNVSVASYPDDDFTGVVEDIGESTYNSSTGTTYVEISVKLGGETSMLYERNGNGDLCVQQGNNQGKWEVLCKEKRSGRQY